jgi:hypothetical protein
MTREDSDALARRFARIISSLFCALTIFLGLSPVINPDGAITSVPILFLSLPWDLVGSYFHWESAAMGVLIGIGCALNAALFYWVAKKVGETGTGPAILLFLVWITLAALPIVFFNDQEAKGRVRIVKRPTGTLLATNEEGLKLIGDSGPDLNLPSDSIILLSRGTRSHAKQLMYLMPDGRMVDPYPTTPNDMERNHVIVVERVRVVEGPSKGAEGWVRSDSMGHILTIGAL